MLIAMRSHGSSGPRVLLARLLPAILFLVLCGALVRGQSAPISLVQHTGKDAGTTTSSSLAFTANNTAGNWIAVVIRGGGTGQVFTVSDSRGNTYRKAIQFNETIDATTLGLFYAENIAGGANTITVSNSFSGTLRFAILEYAGVATSNSLDVTATAQGTSSAPTTPTVTTTASGDLVIGILSTANPRTFTAGSGYVIQERVPVAPNTKLVAEDRIQATAGSVLANGTLNASDTWGAAVAAFRAAAAERSGHDVPDCFSVRSRQQCHRGGYGRDRQCHRFGQRGRRRRTVPGGRSHSRHRRYDCSVFDHVEHHYGDKYISCAVGPRA